MSVCGRDTSIRPALLLVIFNLDAGKTFSDRSGRLVCGKDSLSGSDDGGRGLGELLRIFGWFESWHDRFLMEKKTSHVTIV